MVQIYLLVLSQDTASPLEKIDYISDEVLPDFHRDNGNTAGGFDHRTLSVNVAEWSASDAQSTPRLADRDRWRRGEYAHVELICQRPVSTRRVVASGYGCTDNLCSIFGVEVLPDPKHPIDHGMVEEEDWVAPVRYRSALGSPAFSRSLPIGDGVLLTGC